MEEIKIKLEKKEILFLAALIGSEEFIGIENSLFSLGEDEIQKVWVEVQNSLEEKQFIEVNFDGSIIVDELIYAIIYTCANANIYLNQKLSEQDREARDVHYYITEYLALKMEEDSTDENLVYFDLLLNVDDVYEEFIKNFSLKNLPLCSSEKVMILEETLEVVKGLIKNNNPMGAQEILLKSGVPIKVAIELLELLSQPQIYNSLIMFSFEDENPVDVSELIFIQSDNHLWHCKPNILESKTYYEFTSKLYTDCLENIYTLLKKIESTYIYGKEEQVI